MERKEVTNEEQTKTLGKGDKGARAKSESAAKQNTQETEGWPTVNGRPMVKIQMQASELIPTGRYANVMVGPAVVTAFIDPEDNVGFSGDFLENVTQAINQLAEIVERDVIGVQRNLVLASLQDQVSQ